ncbi:hypothetical protein TRFO_37492 [Tritrichomonas foetus]|uniref:Uncharacterized protein n=1 Tax=Tritrichomonas foetus TaxID=1144522 RepID=A0A1J4JFZ0_9EUKA|nr:hypothetical protein TRFO_37492 [Tritrichomonas foetus]|eukprot:OHS96381.1 hypothetical protein TRFO_37492 [Tritrichomonas foetus]
MVPYSHISKKKVTVAQEYNHQSFLKKIQNLLFLETVNHRKKTEGQNPTQSQLAPEFQRILEQLEDIANKSKKHRRKFQYACNQFRKKIDLFSKHATDDVLKKNQINAYRYVYNSARKKQQLFSQYSMQCWAKKTLEVKSSVVAAEL